MGQLQNWLIKDPPSNPKFHASLREIWDLAGLLFLKTWFLSIIYFHGQTIINLECKRKWATRDS